MDPGQPPTDPPHPSRPSRSGGISQRAVYPPFVVIISLYYFLLYTLPMLYDTGHIYIYITYLDRGRSTRSSILSTTRRTYNIIIICISHYYLCVCVRAARNVYATRARLFAAIHTAVHGSDLENRLLYINFFSPKSSPRT